MLTGFVSFNCQVTGGKLLSLPPLEVSAPNSPAVQSVELSTTDEHRCLSIKVTFKEVSSKDEAISIARFLALRMIDLLAFRHNLAVLDPALPETSFQSVGDKGTISASMTCSLHMSGHVVIAINEADEKGLKSELESQPQSKEIHYARFRWIMCQDDPVSRYMFFYQMLLLLKGGPNGTQKPVDDFIERLRPNVEKRWSSFSKRNVTIYTHFRNQVGHAAPGVAPATTRADIDEKNGDMIEFVKNAIDDS
jgi:hypothetical protein